MHEWCRPLVVGHPGVVRRAVELWQTDLHVQEIDSPDEAEPIAGVIPCLACGSDDVLDISPGQARRPGRAGGLRRGGRGGTAGPGRQGRCDHHGAVAEGGPAPGRTRLSRPYGVAGKPLRRRELRHDALPGPGRRAALARRAGRGPRHAAHGPAERVRRIDRRRRAGQGPAGRRFHDAADGQPAADRHLRAQSARRRGRPVRRRRADDHRAGRRAGKAEGSISPARCPPTR